MKTWEEFVTAFDNLTVYRGEKYKPGTAPHKPCLLLAVIEAIEDGEFRTNQIRYEPFLLERFEHYFKVATANISDKIDYGEFQAYYPFINLDREEFWNLHQGSNKPLQLSSHERNSLARSGPRRIVENVDFASLDNRLYRFLLKPDLRQSFRQAIIEKWFPNQQAQMWAAVRDAHEQKKFESDFFEKLPEITQRDLERVSERRYRLILHRDSKFRTAVLHAYNFRCAATGWRLKTNEGDSLLEAAHIMPLAEKTDNRPQNGLALVPTIHKAMDNHLIAPGPDLKWHASKFLRGQAKFDGGAKWLWNLNEKPLNLPQIERLRPATSVLEWRYEQLLK